VSRSFRLLIATDTDIEGVGGSERHIRVLARELGDRGHEVRVLQLAPRVPTPRGQVGNARFDHWPTGPVLSLGGLRRVLQLRSLIVTEKFDAVLTFFESSDMIAVAAAALCGMRALLSSRRDTGFRLSSRMVRAYRLINGRFKVIIAASAAVRDSLILTQATPDEQIRVVHNGVAFSDDGGEEARQLRQALRIGEGEHAFIYVGNFDEWKDHATLIRAFALLGENSKAVLVLAGAGNCEDSCRALVEELSVSARVRFLGSRRDVPRLLRACDSFVMPSRTEGLSNALLEAMAAGLPVIATRVGGNPEVVDEGVTGELVGPGEPATLAQRMAALLADPGRARAFGAAGRERVVAHFSMPAMVNAYEKAVWDSITAARGTA
jgi:glycosyltransferase involved in cell wall biosynthesis